MVQACSQSIDQVERIMAGTKVAVGKVAKPKEKAVEAPSNTEAKQQETPQVTEKVKVDSETQLPVTTEGQVTEQGSLGKEEDTQANKTATSEAQGEKEPIVLTELKPKKSPVTKKVTETPKQTEAQVKPPEKNPFKLKIHNKGRRRLLQFCGVFLEAGQTTSVVLKSQQEVEHVKDTLRQFNELAGRDDLIVEEAE